MEISKKDLTEAFEKAGLNPQDVEQVWTSLEKEPPHKFDFSNWLYYLGALVIISAMTWLLNLSWEWFKGGAILVLSLLYAFVFYSLGSILWKKEHLKIPAGLLITIGVCMTPLIIYGFGTYFKMIPENGISLFSVRSTMTLGTILIGLIALWYFTFPFLTAPLFFAAFLFTLDVADQLAPYDVSNWIALTFGLTLVTGARLIEKRTQNDYAFWAYLFGALLFWFSLTDLMGNKSESIFFFYLIINIVLMILSILLQRSIFMILGVIGTFIYLGHLAYNIFGNTILFPIALGIIGLALIYVGILFQRKRK